MLLFLPTRSNTSDFKEPSDPLDCTAHLQTFFQRRRVSTQRWYFCGGEGSDESVGPVSKMAARFWQWFWYDWVKGKKEKFWLVVKNALVALERYGVFAFRIFPEAPDVWEKTKIRTDARLLNSERHIGCYFTGFFLQISPERKAIKTCVLVHRKEKDFSFKNESRKAVQNFSAGFQTMLI